MKNYLKTIYIFISICILGALGGCAPISSDNLVTGSIVGTVSDRTTGEPISTVTVSLQPGGKSTVTGNDGAFAFTGLEPGEYFLMISKEGYNPNTIQTVVKGGEPSAVHVTIERIPSAITADKSELDFGDALTTLSFTIVNSGYTDLEYQINYGDVEWLSVDPMEDVLKYGKTATIIVKVDRSKLPDGYNEANIVVRSTSGNGNAEVKVIAVNNTHASVNTLDVSDITNTSAIFNGEIVNPGQPAYTERGFVFDTQGTPTLEQNEGKFSAPVNNNPLYAVKVSGLSPTKTYYVRAYMLQNGNTIYGNIVAFSTSRQATTLSTSAPTNVGATSATLNATITNAGAPPYTERGFCYSKSNSTPTVADTRLTVGGTGTGNFSVNVTNLDYPATYYVRAYAVQQGETIYGNTTSFMTSSASVTVITVAASDITSSSAVLNGMIGSVGEPPYTEKGFCVSNYGTPTIENSKFVVGGSGSGNFSYRISGLESGSTYQFRAYAIQEGKAQYGNTLSVSTGYTQAQVVTQDVTAIGYTSATFNGSVTNIGDPRITERGFCYSTNSYPSPSISDNVVKVSGAVAGNFKADVKNLEEDTRYYVRAYVIQDRKPEYGGVKVFETGYAPYVVTLPPTNVKAVDLISWQATFKGALIDGYPGATEFGFVYSNYTNPTVNNGTVVSGGTLERLPQDNAYQFTRTVNNLSNFKIYYVRAYVKTSLGYVYGENETFSTY